ncbi:MULTISPECIES: carbonic anhydrase [unclassified Psychrobacillus]|uniref:beta-class carbonic anhydrase n=1 Tax=unclassified Psychrobacillus TaxID=2636677 RepID=UPI00146BB61E|nr:MULTISPECIES: carbonic anhydrase [unclassified Psychrobacillus]MCM3360065.1 carbonic anhydrase [Psychrobacillus sp. MER TA 171]NME07034.1 carbonic anhydrase [Psychrobacillus sp. BL-248-WT-3]
MPSLNDILTYNKSFVENKLYEPYVTTKFPDKRIVILTCMDTRLVEMLPKSMNLKNGDVKIVKSAGAVINHPFGGIMRSLIVAVYELQADEIYVIGHHDCGMSSIQTDKILEKMTARGVNPSTFDVLKNSGIEVEEWLEGFSDVKESVLHSVEMIRNHPLMISEIPVHGLIIDPHTGRLDLVTDGKIDKK